MKSKQIILALIAVIIIAVAVVYMLMTDKNVKNLASVVNFKNQNSELQKSTGQEEQKGGLADLNLPSNLPENLNVNKLTAKDGSQNEATVIAFVEKERLVVAIEAKLPQPSGTNHYAVWLTKGDGSYFPLGKLEKTGENFGISANFQGDFSTYKTVVVTLETNDDKLPEKIILEGALSK